MDRPVRQKQHERPIAFPFDEGHRPIGQDIGDVALGPTRLPTFVEEWIDRFSLASHGSPVVEPRAPGLVDAHVPLADERGAAPLWLRGIDGMQLFDSRNAK